MQDVTQEELEIRQGVLELEAVFAAQEAEETEADREDRRAFVRALVEATR